MIQAIDTFYKGYRFRSRTEARWAVFFDALGIPYRYELEGYVLSDGTKYLPDFWLPTFSKGMFVEVKPHGGDFRTAMRFAEEMTAKMWLADDIPSLKWYLAGYPILEAAECKDCRWEWDPPMCNACGKANWVCKEFRWEAAAPLYLDAESENRMYWAFDDGVRPGERLDYPSESVAAACLAAQQARFEHGESGAPQRV